MIRNAEGGHLLANLKGFLLHPRVSTICLILKQSQVVSTKRRPLGSISGGQEPVVGVASLSTAWIDPCNATGYVRRRICFVFVMKPLHLHSIVIG